MWTSSTTYWSWTRSSRAGASTDVVAAEAASTTGPAFAKGAWTIEDGGLCHRGRGGHGRRGALPERRGGLPAGRLRRALATARRSGTSTASRQVRTRDEGSERAARDRCRGRLLARARDDAAADKALPGVLTVSVRRRGGSDGADRDDFARPPRPGALSVAASGGVVDVAEDGRVDQRRQRAGGSGRPMGAGTTRWSRCRSRRGPAASGLPELGRRRGPRRVRAAAARAAEGGSGGFDSSVPSVATPVLCVWHRLEAYRAGRPGPPARADCWAAPAPRRLEPLLPRRAASIRSRGFGITPHHQGPIRAAGPRRATHCGAGRGSPCSKPPPSWPV